MLIYEFWSFLKERKKYWLFPVVATILVLGFLILFSQATVLPFVYTLF